MELEVIQPKCADAPCECKKRAVGTLWLEGYDADCPYWVLTECIEFDTSYKETWLKVTEEI